MNVEVSILMTVTGLLLSLATFFIGRTAAARKEGNSFGGMLKDIAHIRELTERIEATIERNQKQNQYRIDELDKAAFDAAKTAFEANIGQRAAHKRIDEIKSSMKL